MSHNITRTRSVGWGPMNGQVIPKYKDDGYHIQTQPVYVDRRQSRMLRAFRQNGHAGGYAGLLTEVYGCETRHGTKPHASRLIMQKEWGRHASILLLQIDRRVLEAMLDNTLPEKYVNDPTFPTLCRRSDEATSEIDPGIYVNYLATSSGGGLTIDEYKEFLDAMEFALPGHAVVVSRPSRGTS